MRHRTERFSSPTAYRRRFRPACGVGAAISAAGGAARTPAGAPSVPNGAADGPDQATGQNAIIAGNEVHVP
jgi:hypothetical protein